MISKENVIEFQNKWGEGIISISNSFKSGDDYLARAKDFINNLYAYSEEEVLFKPTLASEAQFRLNRVAALSYFIGENPDFSEDSGFAIKGWNSVRWENSGIKLEGNIAICMGNYYFGKENEEDLKVEYSLVLKRLENGELKIILHESHFPYKK